MSRCFYTCFLNLLVFKKSSPFFKIFRKINLFSPSVLSNLAKVEVEGSNLFARSNRSQKSLSVFQEPCLWQACGNNHFRKVSEYG